MTKLNDSINRSAMTVVFQLRDYLADMPDSVTVKSFSRNTYLALGQVVDAVTLEMGEGQELGIRWTRLVSVQKDEEV